MVNLSINLIVFHILTNIDTLPELINGKSMYVLVLKTRTAAAGEII